MSSQLLWASDFTSCLSACRKLDEADEALLAVGIASRLVRATIIGFTMLAVLGLFRAQSGATQHDAAPSNADAIVRGRRGSR